jgi:hypothetical protein
MKKINEINITINKAVITKVSIEIKESGVVFDVFGKLVTDKGIAISDFCFSSEAWYNKERQLDIPVSLHATAREVFEKLTPIVYTKINGVFASLPEKL